MRLNDIYSLPAKELLQVLMKMAVIVVAKLAEVECFGLICQFFYGFANA
jgi:hypothetical protein